MLPTLFLAVLAVTRHVYGHSLRSRNSSAASCTATLNITSGSNANTFVLLPSSSDQAWAVTGQVDAGNHNFSVIVPDPYFVLVWMNSQSPDTGWISSQLYNKSRSVGPECSKSYSQPFNFTMASKEFVIGVPNRIWWDAGKTAGNVTFRVTTLGAGRHTAWDTRTSVISIPDITEVEGQGVGFDWHPSIEPWASFVITLGDDRGIGSGGSLRGTAASPAFLCAYQMSGTYPVLQRLLLYILFLLGTIGLFTASGWLTGPFLGGAMAYAGSAAIHSIIILASSNKSSQKGTIDLDAIPIFQILSVCLYLCAPLLLGSYTLRKHTGETSATVVVVSVWAVLIIVGFFCSLLVEGPAAIAPCAPYNATLPDGTYRTVPTDAGLCAEMCAIKSSLIREVGEAEMLDSTITLHGVFGGLWELGFFVGIACAIGVTSITIVTIFAPNAGGGALTAMMELGGTSTTRSTRPRARRSRRVKKGDSGPACLVFFILVAAPIALVIQLALGEHRLAKAALVSEKSYAVGQWGPWVMVGLALVSSVFFLLTSSTRYGAEPIPEDAPIPPDESTRT